MIQYLLRKPLIRRDKGDTLSLLVKFLLKPWVPFASLPASLLFSRLSGLEATEPILFCLRFSSFHPSLPRFPHRVYNSCAVSCTSSPLLCPPRPRPRSRTRSHPRPRSISATALVSVPAPVPVPILRSSTGLYPCPRTHLAFLRSPSLPFPFPLRPRPYQRPRPSSRPRLRSRP